jgi:hypothetical protein
MATEQRRSTLAVLPATVHDVPMVRLCTEAFKGIRQLARTIEKDAKVVFDLLYGGMHKAYHCFTCTNDWLYKLMLSVMVGRFVAFF